MPVSQKQLFYLAAAWQCFDTEPKIDFVRLASIASLASAGSARVLFRTAKKRLMEEYSGDGAAGEGKAVGAATCEDKQNKRKRGGKQTTTKSAARGGSNANGKQIVEFWGRKRGRGGKGGAGEEDDHEGEREDGDGDGEDEEQEEEEVGIGGEDGGRVKVETEGREEGEDEGGEETGAGGVKRIKTEPVDGESDDELAL